MGVHIPCAIEDTKHDIEPLDPGHAVDEIEAGARVAPNITDDEEDVLVIATNRGVQSPLQERRESEIGVVERVRTYGPDLGMYRHFDLGGIAVSRAIVSIAVGDAAAQQQSGARTEAV